MPTHGESDGGTATGPYRHYFRHAAEVLTLDEVAEELATSHGQTYALVRRGDLAGIKLGGRGQWRVERSKLEEYIEQLYEDTRHWVNQHPWTEPGGRSG